MMDSDQLRRARLVLLSHERRLQQFQIDSDKVTENKKTMSGQTKEKRQLREIWDHKSGRKKKKQHSTKSRTKG
jgi:hypothetical protein